MRQDEHFREKNVLKNDRVRIHYRGGRDTVLLSHQLRVEFMSGVKAKVKRHRYVNRIKNVGQRAMKLCKLTLYGFWRGWLLLIDSTERVAACNKKRNEALVSDAVL